MVRRILHRYLYRKHSWREFAFDELNQIYAAMLVRGLSLSMVGLFVPVFMSRLGYTITQILTVIVCYFAMRVIFDLAAAQMVARYGPKHTMIFGQILFAASSAQFLTLEQIAWPLWLLGLAWGASQSCFFVSFDVNFSKIRHGDHGGKELGYIEIMSKIGSILGPVVGGVISVVFGAQYIFAISTVLLVGGLLPMLRTPEPIKLRRRLNYNGLAIRKITPHLPSFIGSSVEKTLVATLWPLYMGLFVVPGSNVFMKIGILSSVAAALSILFAHRIGHHVDEGRGRSILRAGAYFNACLHMVRAFIGSYPVVFTANVAGELATLGHRLPFMKAYYDLVDDFKEERIVFVSVLNVFGSIVKTVVYALLLMLSTITTGRTFFFVAFSVAAIASVLVTTEKFKHFERVKIKKGA